MQFGFSILRLADMHLCLWLQGEEEHTHEEWMVAIRQMQAIREGGIPAEQVRSLVMSDGAVPNTIQRKLILAIWNGKQVRSAVLTTELEHPIKRGIATAFTWVNPQLAFYRPEGVNEALAHVEATHHTERIWTEYQKLQQDLPPIQTLARATKVLQRRAVDPKSPSQS